MGSLALGAIAPAAAIGIITVNSQAAQAATVVSGMSIYSSNAYGHFPIGYFESNGVPAFCGKFAVPDPLGSTEGSLNVTSTYVNHGGSSISITNIQKINYLASRFTNLVNAGTQTPQEAAATQIAVWMLVGDIDFDGTVIDGHVTGAGYHTNGTNIFTDGGMGSVQALNAALLTEATTMTADTGGDPAALTVSLAPGSSYDGDLNVPAHYTTIHATNAIFDASGTNTLTVTGAGSYAFHGTPPDGVREYQIDFSGDWSKTFYSQQMRNADAAAGKQSMLTGVGSTTRTGTMPLVISDPLDTQFEPVLTSQVPTKFVKVGDQFTDTVTFDIAPTSQPWRTNLAGSFAPVTATGVLYGPFLNKPTAGAPIPVGAPVASTTTVTTTTTLGPGTYNVTWPGVGSEESGFYQAVWTIDGANNPNLADHGIMDPAYSFVDQFGIESEQQITKTVVKFHTDLSTAVDGLIYPGDNFTDRVTIGAVENGSWLSLNGSRVPLSLIGHVYETPVRPVQSNTVPSGAVEVQTLHGSFAGPNRSFVSDPITVTPASGNYLVVRWETDETAANADFIEAYADPYGATSNNGLASEWVRAMYPQVVTQATRNAEPGQAIRDTATVTGPMPADPAKHLELTFSAYYAAPVVEGGIVEPARCTPETLRTDNEDHPIMVTEAGTYTSPEIPFASSGTYYWVERLYEVGADNSKTLLSEGECGLDTETSRVQVLASASSKAEAKVVSTGIDNNPTVIGGGIAAAIAAAIAATFLFLKRRKTSK